MIIPAADFTFERYQAGDYGDHCIIHGDCRDVLPKIPDKAIDLIWTDPPYNVGKDYGVYKDNLPLDEFVAFTCKWIIASKRLSDALCVYTPHKWRRLFDNELGDGYHQIILPRRAAGAIRNGFANHFAFLLTNAKARGVVKDVWDDVQSPGMGYFFKEHRFGHPGFSSEHLNRRVLKAFSDEGQLILDPFGGVGTVHVAAKNLNRRSISVELTYEHCLTAEQRLAQEVLSL